MSKVCSVCMATYNGEAYIKQQVESILIQLSPTDELIISDDGSTDDTLQLLHSFNDKRIKIFPNNRHKGPVGNFENALMKASGDIIFLADQDDKWKADKVSTHLFLHKNNDLVISDAVVVDQDGKTVFNSFFEERGSKPGFINNIKRNSYIGCCMSFNRRILNLALPFPSYIHMHDWWIGLIAEIKGKPYFCTDKLMYYVRHQNNASPTLGYSGYSAFKRMKNRFQLLVGLLSVLFK
ncbi:glycosyltransferase family 2 protein [Mucilaginibacter segetis]|uniref:Glycosyltransferase family 2 protein n=1 Tax=Mucilaginibacter segetis TaxID=2793071 RepID=A0A934UPI3_9SPHI|nr:glycosyltransferase family 2 protein [Mucilaginibacter segetis]MBK0381145.1 glycosyltransferase family 2 protein [Mucilaginibacter segetis]